MRNWLNLTAVLMVLLLIAAPADAAGRRKQGAKLEQMQNAYAAAIRWGDFEQAWQWVDPAYREAHPMTALAFERYQQVQVSSYADRNSAETDDGRVVRNIELRVVNKHTMAERSLRYQEQWGWDPVSKRWWLVVGLPDLWNGE